MSSSRLSLGLAFAMILLENNKTLSLVNGNSIKLQKRLSKTVQILPQRHYYIHSLTTMEMTPPKAQRQILQTQFCFQLSNFSF
jgi:hypothetical protein